MKLMSRVSPEDLAKMNILHSERSEAETFRENYKHHKGPKSSLFTNGQVNYFD